MVALVVVLFAIAGVLVYALSNNPKVAELALRVFTCAFLALMFAAVNHTVRLF
jgi:hypothetical protein